MKKKTLLILFLILLISLFFRTYQVVERFEFAHDGDLFSWIVKDILVNHHFRLIGQLTSAPGIFIGGLFYYLLIPFFLISKMDPIGTLYFAIIIGLSTVISYYFVLSKLFKVEVGLIAAFLYGTLLTTVNSDRWVVPTITTNLWVIWYFYTIVKISRGDFRVLPFLGILIGLIWHVHIALLPTLIAIPAAVYFAKKLPTAKQAVQFFTALLITSLPLLMFEIRHGFGQTLNFITNSMTPRVGATGLYKLTLVFNMITKNISALFTEPQSLAQTFSIFFFITILISLIWLVKKKALQQKELIVFLIWIGGVAAFFGFSQTPISEYYFTNLNIIFITSASLLLSLFLKSTPGKIFVIGILIFITLKNGYVIITQGYYNKGYIERKAVVDYIKQDAKNRGFPCIGINYITVMGENVGFRYFFYLSKLHQVHPSVNIPVYNIVIPDELSKDEVKVKFGHIGIIPPVRILPEEVIQKSCETPDTNLTDSMFGYVE